MRADRPSATARLVARGVTFVARDPHLGALVPPSAAEIGAEFLRAASPREARLLRLTGRPWFRALVAFVERHTTPGLLLHFVLRKRFLEDTARNSLGAGFTRIVVLGAGFDTLALRLAPEFPGTAFFEVDHPATQAPKRRVLERDAGGLPPNLWLLTADLSRPDWDRTLRDCPAYRADAGAATLFVAEGLLMYLEAGAVDAIFRAVRGEEEDAAARRFAFTFLEPQPGGGVNFRYHSRLVDAWLRLRGEPFRWGVGAAALPGFVEARGFTGSELTTPDDLRRRYLPAEGAHGRTAGDTVCVAENRPATPV